MKILVTGASGWIGSNLCGLLQGEGYEIRALSRSSGSHGTLPSDIEIMEWDPITQPPPPACFKGIETIIHLAGESVAGRWTKVKKKAIRNSRVLGTRHLVQGIASTPHKPHVLISASAIGYYGERGETLLQEEDEPGQGFLAGVCLDWEKETARAQSLGVRTAWLRIGIVLGSAGGALKQMLPLYKIGMGGALGKGHQWWSWIHLGDLLHLIHHVLQNPLQGAINATSPVPCRQRDFARALGRVLNRPAWFPSPTFILRLALGEFAQELLTSCRVIPARAHEGGYKFRFPGITDALADIL